MGKLPHKTEHSNGMLTGVCGGIGRVTGINPNIIRAAAVVGTYFTGLFPIVVGYVVLIFVMPKEGLY